MIDKRTKRIRTKLKKVSSRNRLSVFRSNNHIYAQAIDDSKGITLASASTLEKELVKDQIGRKELAATIGKEIAKRLIFILYSSTKPEIRKFFTLEGLI